MTATVFVDTNVLIYAVDVGEPRKQLIAHAWMAELWKTGCGRLSFQVLQEFYAKVIQKKLAAREQARAEIRELLAWRPVSLDKNLLESGWQYQDRFQLSFWDSLIVAAAKGSTSRYLLTEDLHEGQDLDGVLVVNPFSTDPVSLF